MSPYGLTHQIRSILSVTLVIGLLAACRPSSATPAVPNATAIPAAAVSTAVEIPLVVISSPEAGQSFEPGQTIRVQSESVAATGINRLELMVNDRVVAADEFIPQPNAALITKQGWAPDLPGRYVLQVRAYTPANLVGQSAPVVVEVGAATGGGAITATPNISTATPATPTPAQVTITPTATTRPSSAQSSLPTRTLTPTPKSPAASPTPDYPYLQVNAALSLNVRAGPSTQYQRVGALQPGETARIRGQNDVGAGRWWQISYIQAPNGVGWVSSSPNYSIAFNTSQVPVVSVPSLPATLTPAPTLPPAGSSGGLDFTVDRTTVRAGECVTFRWNVSNVKEVYYRGGGVPGDNQTRLECPTWTQYYELRVVYRDGTINSKTIRIDVEGGSTYRTVDMEAGQTIDFDKDGKVSDDDGDDFEMKEDDDELIFEKWDDDDDLEQVPVGPVDSLDVIRKEDCDWALDHLDDTNRIRPFPGLAVCFRTDDGRLGKLRFDDVDDNDARIQWALW
jgi:hypothetical protein